MEIVSAVRRLRQYISDKPRGRSMSASGFSTDITALSSPNFKLSIDGEAVQTISVVPTTLNTGAEIAAALQTAIRAAVPSDNNYAFATVRFDSVLGYTIWAGEIGEISVVVTPGTTGTDLASYLKLGLNQSGTEDYFPPARYSDDDLEIIINTAFQQYNGSVGPDKQLYLETVTETDFTVIIYYAWRMVLESDAGTAVYSYNQRLGEDELDMSALFKNILEFLAYLSARIDKMKDDLGIGSIFVSEITRYDRNTDMRVPEHVPSQMPRPRFLNLSKVSASVALVEWQRTNMRDFQAVQLYTHTASGILDLSRLTESGDVGEGNGVIAAATKQMEIANRVNTVHKVTGLSGVVYFLLVFRDTRGECYYSDEYSLDLNDSDPSPILTVNNARGV